MRARELRLGPITRPRMPPMASLAATPPPARLTCAESPSWRFYAPLAAHIALPNSLLVRRVRAQSRSAKPTARGGWQRRGLPPRRAGWVCAAHSFNREGLLRVPLPPRSASAPLEGAGAAGMRSHIPSPPPPRVLRAAADASLDAEGRP
ncbi:uncharacterized protein SCHCODRAFT_02564028 [Schizophyllum commune H4-8]|uniref:uncharacterized protein n=1 Tax=Schizophyllum commune (strain H4-8 / FGSC 9210) TaxID=578458 RepID=UPI00215ED3E2|nr:uncharacterized protein SCHCODRAFT_02564028 [Schizophyllum commune H4-8]KAI5897429.1 hypothetical protein SCHCODRAFT_02564028 [Schizophyllum commune H4-8]